MAGPLPTGRECLKHQHEEARPPRRNALPQRPGRPRHRQALSGNARRRLEPTCSRAAYRGLNGHQPLNRALARQENCQCVAAWPPSTRHRTVKLFTSEQLFFAASRLDAPNDRARCYLRPTSKLGLWRLSGLEPERTALRARIWAARSRNVLVMQGFVGRDLAWIERRRESDHPHARSGFSIRLGTEVLSKLDLLLH